MTRQTRQLKIFYHFSFLLLNNAYAHFFRSPPNLILFLMLVKVICRVVNIGVDEWWMVWHRAGKKYVWLCIMLCWTLEVRVISRNYFVSRRAHMVEQLPPKGLTTLCNASIEQPPITVGWGCYACSCTRSEEYFMFHSYYLE